MSYATRFIDTTTANRYIQIYGGSIGKRDINGYRSLLDFWKRHVCFVK